MRSRILLGLFCLALAIIPAIAQNGTPHGVNVSFTPAVGAIGSNVYRCSGTCLTTSTWGKVNSAVVTASVNCSPTGTDTLCYLDQSSSLVAGNTYSYAATDIDANGNESAFSNISTVSFAAIVNPPAPTGCNSKVQ